MQVALVQENWTAHLFYADKEMNPPFLSTYQSQCPVIQQQGEDLGSRMHQAAQTCFQRGFSRVVIIGTDCLSIGVADLKAAFFTLQESPYCIGPSADGGYYLIGMRELHSEPFQGIEWGTDTVLRKTLEKCNQMQHNVSLLSEKEDIDTAPSLHKFILNDLEGPIAPLTSQFIRENKHRLPSA